MSVRRRVPHPIRHIVFYGTLEFEGFDARKLKHSRFVRAAISVKRSVAGNAVRLRA